MIKKVKSPHLFYLFVIFTLLFIHTLQSSAQEEKRQAGETRIQKEDQTGTGNEEIYKQLSLFGDVFERVRVQYVEEVSDRTLIKYAINGMLSSLDPHSAYLDEEDFKNMQVSTSGEFGGLGIEVTMENGLVKVVAPIDDTPAYEAGIVAGDYITHIDGEQVIGLSLSEAVEKMRGPVGAPINLTVQREDVKEPIELQIVRDIIRIESVKYDTVGNIGYIRITTFNKNTESGLNKAIREIQKTLPAEQLEGYILDLRNNPGGLLHQAIAVSDAFLEQGEIVSRRGRTESETKRDNATSGDLAEGKPLIILINGGSASASEIVAGALQDHRRAIVLGTPSFGKGSVQTVIPLSENGAMRLTTARYYTPSGRSIQAKGIEPDILIEPAKVEGLDIRRTREADLHGALDNDQVIRLQDSRKTGSSDAKTKGQNADKKSKGDAKKIEKTAKGKKKQGLLNDEDILHDYQLSRAIDLIKGLHLYQGHYSQSKSR